MEYLDTYDEKGHFLEKRPRDVVHRDALWHKTVHCWLYDHTGNIYFQIRKDEGTLYTTASGHVLAGESIQEGFAREIKEEIGFTVAMETATLVSITPFIMDKVKADGKIFKDRAFAHVYVSLFTGVLSDFHFDLTEINGVVKVKARDVLSLFHGNKKEIIGVEITEENGENKEKEVMLMISSFLVNMGEVALTKYGDVLTKIIELTS